MSQLPIVWLVTESNKEPFEPPTEQTVGIFASKEAAKAAAMRRAQQASNGRGLRIPPELPNGAGSVSTNNGMRSVWWGPEEVLP